MKASVKFREEQKPLLRAKVPLNMLGLPFQSGIVAGESKELTLSLGTFFESGPSIRLAYRPNDTCNPFSVVVKTGAGSFGSPVNSSMLMSAEFNLLNNNHPSFMLHFKPHFGDFSIKKSSHSSVLDKMLGSADNGVVSKAEAPKVTILPFEDVDGEAEVLFSSGKKRIFTAERNLAGLLSGMEVSARTSVPVRNKGVVSLRWGVRVPAELKSGDYSTAAGVAALRKIPFLVMNKIRIEHVDGGDTKAGKTKAAAASAVSALTFPGNVEVAEACFSVKRQLEALQSENGLLRKAVEDLRHKIAGGGKYREMERSNGNWRNSHDKKSSQEGDVSEEFKKSLKGA